MPKTYTAKLSDLINEKIYTATFSGKRYEQLERLSKKSGSKLKVIIEALNLLEKAKNL